MARLAADHDGGQSSQTEQLTSEASEEPRRSRRANKGNNSDRWQEILDSAKHNLVNPESVAGDTATDAGTVLTHDVGEFGNATEHYEDDAIRCVCGQVTEVEDDDKTFIQCDQCSVWQHAPCVGLSDDNIPEQYFCERCRPDLHAALLKDITSGKFKKSKRSKVKPKVEKKRKRATSKTPDSDQDHIPSDVDPGDENMPNSPKRMRSISPSDVSVVSEASDEVVARAQRITSRAAATQGRSITRTKPESRGKIADNKKPSSADGKSRSKRMRSIAEPYSELSSIADSTRKAIGTALITLMKNAISLATEHDGLSLSCDTDNYARILGLEIEFALYQEHFEPPGQPDQYKAKYRQLLFNLKDPKNPLLRKRLLSGSLKPTDLVTMSSADMANPEIKAMTEAVREEGLKQSVLVQETGPRIRRTHKGEEYVEGPEANVDASTIEVPMPSRSRVNDDMSDSASVRSPSPSYSPEHLRSPEPPVAIERERSRSTSNFDLKNVWSHMESPSGSEPVPTRAKGNHEPQRSSTKPIDTNDEDLLELLDDESNDGLRRHDYSTMDTVWSGNLSMSGVTDAKVKASVVAGPSSFEVNWDEMLTSVLSVGGRIAKPGASDYLCHQRHSKSKSVYALLIQDDGGSAVTDLYRYFTTKDRYGVLKPGNKKVRDGYVIPLPANSDAPEFITMLPAHNLSLNETQNILLVVLVVENSQEASVEPPIVEKTEEKPVEAQSQLPMINSSSLPPARPPAIPHYAPPHKPAPIPQWQPPAYQAPAYASNIHHQQQQHLPTQPPYQGTPSWQQPHQYESAEDAYNRRVNMSRQGPSQPQPVPQIDPNAQAILATFLRAHPDIASDPRVTSSPQLMGQLLEEFVRAGNFRR